MKPKQVKPVKAWMIKGRGLLYWHGVAETKGMMWLNYTFAMSSSQRAEEAAGYTCVPVLITEIKRKGKK